MNEFCLYIFVHLSLRLINDESPKIKQLSSITIKNLLAKLDAGKFESIFQMIYEWLKDENVLKFIFFLIFTFFSFGLLYKPFIIRRLFIKN